VLDSAVDAEELFGENRAADEAIELRDKLRLYGEAVLGSGGTGGALPEIEGLLDIVGRGSSSTFVDEFQGCLAGGVPRPFTVTFISSLFRVRWREGDESGVRDWVCLWLGVCGVAS
jgi:hypothetical protein